METRDYVLIAIIFLLLFAFIMKQSAEINEIKLLVENITIGKI